MWRQKLVRRRLFAHPSARFWYTYTIIVGKKRGCFREGAGGIILPQLVYTEKKEEEEKVETKTVGEPTKQKESIKSSLFQLKKVIWNLRK